MTFSLISVSARHTKQAGSMSAGSLGPSKIPDKSLEKVKQHCLHNLHNHKRKKCLIIVTPHLILHNLKKEVLHLYQNQMKRKQHCYNRPLTSTARFIKHKQFTLKRQLLLLKYVCSQQTSDSKDKLVPWIQSSLYYLTANKLKESVLSPPKLYYSNNILPLPLHHFDFFQ